jgi:hypothetical protein
VAFFDIPTTKVILDPAELVRVFAARNQIAHEMDVDFSQEQGHRLPRDRDVILGHANSLVSVGSAVLAEVDARLS